MFDVVEDHVFVVINHLRNLSNMYLSDPTGIKYQLSLPRVLYHNPFTNVSSPWLRYVNNAFQGQNIFYLFKIYFKLNFIN